MKNEVVSVNSTSTGEYCGIYLKIIGIGEFHGKSLDDYSVKLGFLKNSTLRSGHNVTENAGKYEQVLWDKIRVQHERRVRVKARQERTQSPLFIICDNKVTN